MSCRAEASGIKSCCSAEIEYLSLTSNRQWSSVSVMIRICRTWRPLSPLRNSTEYDSEHPPAYPYCFSRGTDAVRNHLHQPPLLGVQLDGIGHAAVHDARIKGAIDIITCTQFVGTPDRRIRVLASNHNDRGILDGVVGIHGFQHFKSVHNEHIDVQPELSQCFRLPPAIFNAFSFPFSPLPERGNYLPKISASIMRFI